MKISSPLLFLHLSLLFFIPSALAQSFQFETVRTEKSPGFFMVRIFPGESNAILKTSPIFVKSYPKSLSQEYEKLFSLIQNINGRLIEEADVNAYSIIPENKIVYLGTANPKFESFIFEGEGNIQQEFELFHQQFLKNIVLRNIEISFGGNVTDVLPSRIPDIGTEPVFLVGKFKKAIKTQMIVSGEIEEGMIESIHPLNLDNEEFIAPPLADQLPDIWEQLWIKENTPQKDIAHSFTDVNWSNWNNLFPLILLLIGFGTFFFAIKNIRKHQYSILDIQNYRPRRKGTPHTESPIPQESSIPPKSHSQHKTLSEKDAIKILSNGSQSLKTNVSKAPDQDPVPFVDMPQIRNDEKKENKNTPSLSPKAKAQR